MANNRFIVRPDAVRWHCLRTPEEKIRPYDLYREAGDPSPTPLLDVPELADELGVGRVLVKFEGRRLGTPAFKITGALWAAYRALCEEVGSGSLLPPSTLIERVTGSGYVLATATDGNHGHALARTAALFGIGCRVYVPGSLPTAPIAALRAEGAEVVVIDGSYDDTVRVAAAQTDSRTLVIADTAWPGYDRVPGWIVDGYTTILQEVDAQLGRLGARPDLVSVPVGGGTLLTAVLRHYRQRGARFRPRILSVEPETAASAQASLLGDRRVDIPGLHPSVMTGLNCGVLSHAAWPYVRGGLDASVTVSDSEAEAATRRLYKTAGLAVGMTGAASLAGATPLTTDDLARARLGLTGQAVVILLCTEGVTDPVGHARAMAGGQARP